MDVTGIKNDIRDVRIFTGRYFPFVVIPLSYARIIASELVPTAGVNDKGSIIVNPTWWNSLDIESKRYVMIHECLHVALCHPFRAKGFNKETFNIACLRPETTIPGTFKNIDQLKNEDAVYTQSGTGAVKQCFNREYDGDLVKIKAVGLLPFEVTIEHPILVFTRKKTWHKKGDAGFSFDGPSWRNANDINENCYLAIPKPKKLIDTDRLPIDDFRVEWKGQGHTSTKIRSGVPLNEETAWLMGLYVAEGSMSGKDSGIHFTLGSNETESINRLLKINEKHFGYSPSRSTKRNCCTISLPSPILARSFSCWFGRGAHNKRIPEFIIFHHRDEIVRQFLEGYFTGDGHWDKRTNWRYASTVSKTLALQLQLAISRFDSLALIEIEKRPERKLRDKTLPPETIYKVCWKLSPTITTRRMNGHTIQTWNNQWKNLQEYVITRVKKTERIPYNGTVFNIETTDNTYLVSNAITHNCDGKVNHAITQANVSGVDFKHDGLVTLNTLATITRLRVEDLEKMSTEEIVKLLENCGPPSGSEKGPSGTQDSFGDDLLNGEVDGEIVQEGDKSVTLPKTEEDLKHAWKQLCEKAKAFAKQAGTMPASLERIVDEILEVKPPWQVTVRFGLRNSSTFDSSFAYPNRRNDDLPGPLGYARTVWCLIDTSGSIDHEELSYFLGIAKHESKNASLRVISWDAQAYDVLKAERPSEVARKVASKMKGGGGTVCLPVLQRVHKLMNAGDAVLLLSDGEIFDAQRSETQDWFRKVAAKAGFAMIGYTHKPVEAPGFATALIANQKS